MNLNEELLVRMMEILHKHDFEEKVFTMMALAGSEFMQDDKWNHLEMEVAFWGAFTDIMLRPFDKEDYPRVLARYSVFLQGIFEEAAGLPLPTTEEPDMSGPDNTQVPHK